MIGCAVALYRALLGLAPGEFRREHGAESIALFRRMLIEARAEGGHRRAWSVALRGWLGVIGVAVRERLESRRSRERRSLTVRGGGEVAESWTWPGTVKQAMKTVARSPGVTVGVVGLLGLGVGATVTVLSVVDGVLIRSLPYPDADRLALVGEGAHSWPDFEDWRRTVSAFEAIAAASGQTFTLTGDLPRHVTGARVSDRFFEIFGASAAVGRLPTADEYRSGRRVAALGHEGWVRRWGADRGIVGSRISIDGEPFDVVGVLTADFVAPVALTGSGIEVWIPVDPTNPELDRHDRSFAVVGRLADEATLGQASEELRARAEVFAREYPDYATDTGAPERVFPAIGLEEATTGDARDPLLILLLGASLLLLVACANAASLLSAKAVARREELAVRRALGGGRRVIFGQLTVEGIVLGLLGGAVGFGLAALGVEGVRALEPGDLPRVADVSIDLRVAVVTTVIAVLTGFLAGVVPAWRSGRVAPADALRGPRSDAGSDSAGTGAPWLVMLQAMLASLLLLGSMAVVEGFGSLVATDPGFRPEDVSVVSIDVGRDLPEQERPAHVERIRRRLEQMTGVESVGAGISAPYEIAGGRRCCWRGELAYQDRRVERAWVHPVTPGYFAALGIDFREGRGFAPEERSEGTVPIVLNDVAARELFGTASAVGEAVRFATLETTVVGVIEGVRHWGADQPVEAEFYLPYDPRGAWASALSFVVHGADLPPLTALRSTVAEIAPRAIVGDIQPMSAVFRDSRARYRFYTLVLSVFAGCALLLAGAGLTGTLMHDTWRRRYELGVRMALGAPSGGLVWRIVRRALAIIAAGGMLGIGVYWPLRSRIEAVVPGVDPADPLALLGSALLLVGVGLVASGLPARIVASTDPSRTLRP